MSSDAPSICTQCHAVGYPKVKTSVGGAVIGVVAIGAFFVLWFLPILPADLEVSTRLIVAAIIPFVIFLLGMMAGRAKVCEGCGASTLVPLSTPRGQELADEADKKKRARQG